MSELTELEVGSSEPTPVAFVAVEKDGAVSIGRTQSGEHAWYPWRTESGTVRSGAVVGGPGSGRTNAALVITAAIRAAGPTITVHLDPNRGLAAPALARHATRLARDHNEIVAELDWVLRLMRRRGQTAKEEGASAVAALPAVLIVVEHPRFVFGCARAMTWWQIAELGPKLGVATLVVGRNDGPGEFGQAEDIRDTLAT
jgi:hypothetical protein